MKTMRFSPGAGADSFKFASLNFASQGKSTLTCSSCARCHSESGVDAGAMGLSVGLGEAVCASNGEDGQKDEITNKLDTMQKTVERTL